MRDSFISFSDVFGMTTHAGPKVDQANACDLPAVYRCVSLNSDIVSTLPVDVIAYQGENRKKVAPPLWLESPNDTQDWMTFIAQVQTSLELDGNAFILKASTGNGRVVGLNLIPPLAVKVDRLDDGRLIYEVEKNGGKELFAQTAMLHIMAFSQPGAIRGMSPITALRETIGLGKAAEQYGAQFFGTGATLSGVISVPGNTMGPDAVKALSEQFKRKHGGVSKSHAIGILTGGATWHPLSVTPEDSQFLETRRFTDVQIANAFGIPPEHVTEAEGAKGYVTSLYARNRMWLQTGLNPRLARLENAFSSLLPKGRAIKFNRNAFLAMDPTERATFYTQGLVGQWMTPNEIRGKEDMDPLPNGDEPLKSVQWQA